MEAFAEKTRKKRGKNAENSRKKRGKNRPILRTKMPDFEIMWYNISEGKNRKAGGSTRRGASSFCVGKLGKREEWRVESGEGRAEVRGPGEAQRQRVRRGEEEQRSDCAFRPQGGNKGCGACDDEIPGVMFYSDLTNRCSTCSHWYSARILIRGGVLTHCFRLFVPTAGAVESFGVAPCMPNSGQFCAARTNGPFV